MKYLVFALAALMVGACTSQHHGQIPPGHIQSSAGMHSPGSHQKLRAPVSVAEGLEVIISDVVIPPNGQVPRHFHPGEEFLYVIDGYAIHVEEGKADQIIKAGDSYVIPPRAEHAPRGGPDGARAIVFRLHVAGEPERTMVKESIE